MGMAAARIVEEGSREALGARLAIDVAGWMREGIEANGQAALVVSGGSTPAPFFAALGQEALDWNRITVLVADERWVPVDHADSNEGLLRAHLPAATQSILSLAPLHQGESLTQGAARCEAALSRLPEQLDVVILGMGEDGHTASLFPHHPQLAAGLATNAPACLAVEDSPKPPPQRITLSAPRLLASRHVVLHVTGEAKRDVYDRARATDDVQSLPIAHFLHRAPVALYWAA